MNAPWSWEDSAAAFPGSLWWDRRGRCASEAREIRVCREAREGLGSWEFPEPEPADGLGAE